MVEPKMINLSAKKTETGWIKAQDDFFLSVTPIWFDWLKWIFIMAAIQVVADRTHERLVLLILGISYLMFFFYMLAYFYNIEFHGIPLIKSERRRRIVSGILSAFLGCGVFYLLMHLTGQLKT